MARAKKTQSIKDVASGVVRRADRDGKRHGARVVSAWREVVGPDIAKHTKGFAVRGDRELVVFVDSGSWATQLTMMSEELMGRINSHLGEKSVVSLRFTVSKKVKEEADWDMAVNDSLAYYEPDEPPSIALDEVERAQAAHVAAAVANPALREAALRVMVKDLERKKGLRAQGVQGSTAHRPDGAAGPGS